MQRSRSRPANELPLPLVSSPQHTKNAESLKGKAGTTRSKTLSIVRLTAIAAIFMYLGRNFPRDRDMYAFTYSSRNDDVNQAAKTASTTTVQRPICPDTRHLFKDDMTSLTDAYKLAETFHNGGGNFKTIDTYLNNRIDKTYEMMDIQYTPKGAEKPLDATESISQTIVEELRSNDKKKRGGYDQRQYPGTIHSKNEKYFGPNSRGRLDVIEPWDTDRWIAGLGPTFDICKRVDQIGKAKQSYEDKFMCSFEDLRTDGNGEEEKADDDDDEDDDDQKEKTQKSQSSQCEMISIGCNGQWGFEESIAKMTDCTTHTFDCTISGGNVRKPDIDSIIFYPYCVSSTNSKTDDGREYMTYSKLIQQTGMDHPPALFKMDVEGFEFDVMRQMLEEAVETGTTHLLPMQISVELHYASRMFDLAWMQRALTASEIAMFMGMMYKRGGYVPVNVKMIGPGCYSCTEILFVRAFCDY